MALKNFIKLKKCIAKANAEYDLKADEEQVLWLLVYKKIIDENHIVLKPYNRMGFLANRVDPRREKAELLVTHQGVWWVVNFIKKNKELFKLFED
jgi:hypothetical protein